MHNIYKVRWLLELVEVVILQAFADPYQGLARNRVCFFLVAGVSPECKIHYLMKKQQYLSPAVLLLKRESLAGCATFSFLFFLLQFFFLHFLLLSELFL